MKWAETAVISENVYIFAASEGLATGVRALIDRPTLAGALKLGADQSITLAQCVGFSGERLRSPSHGETGIRVPLGAPAISKT